MTCFLFGLSAHLLQRHIKNLSYLYFYLCFYVHQRRSAWCGGAKVVSYLVGQFVYDPTRQ